MKNLTIICCLLYSIACSAQTDFLTGKDQTARIPLSSTSGTLKVDSISSKYLLGSAMADWNRYVLIMDPPQTVMKITQKEGKGDYTVWINRKRLVWLTDSTFTLKSK